MEIGQKIKTLREEKGMTLEELGAKVGVGKSTVRKWETGMIANMRRDKIVKVAKALGTDPSYLMGWDNNNQEIQPVLLGSELNNIFEKLAEEYNKPKEYLISLFFSCDLNHLPASQRILNEKNIRYVLTNLMNNSVEPATLAAHFDGEEYTDDEMDEIKQFAEFVKGKRGK